MQPLVSVIIISYNHSKFIKECLDSLLAQTYKNWELIIADDASKDNSVEVFNEWLAENKVTAEKTYNPKNLGLCKTLNACIVKAKGKYTKLIAADDMMLPQSLENGVIALEQMPDDYGMVYANSGFINEKSERKEENLIADMAKMPEGWVYERLMHGNFIPALTTVIKTDVFKQLGGFDENILTEDYEYWLRLSKKYRIAALPEVLALYRIHGNNISLSHNINDDVIRIMIKHDDDKKFSKNIKKAVRNSYFLKTVSPKLVADYNNYTGKDKWLSLSLNKNLPYKFFRIFDKLKW